MIIKIIVAILVFLVGYGVAADNSGCEQYDNLVQVLRSLVGLVLSGGVGALIWYFMYFQKQKKAIALAKDALELKEIALDRRKSELEIANKERRINFFRFGNEIMTELTEEEKKSQLGVQLRQVETQLHEQYRETFEKLQSDCNRLRVDNRALREELQKRTYSTGPKLQHSRKYDRLKEGEPINRSKQ